jgi:NAD(P)-dependent dehydrogenase (short-subunit alcohol dehydrogenase family)
MDPEPQYQAPTYKGADELALITGGDSGIGRGVAVLYAREGATGEPPHELVAGVGRMVQGCRARLGDGCGPDDVLRERHARGVEVSEGQVRQFWLG